MSTTWSDVKPWIAKIAPMLGTALGGPLGGAAGVLLSNALGIKDASPDSIKAAIQNGTLTGDQIVAMKAAEDNFALQMATLNIKSVQDLQNIEFEDRDSARKRQMTLKDKTPQFLVYLALVIWGGFNGVLLWMAFHGKSLPPDMVGIIMRVLGTMDALLGMGFAFFLGSSHTDAATKEMLYNSTPSGGEK